MPTTQGVTLTAMCIVGVAGLLALIDPPSKHTKRWVLAWMVVWCGPALVNLWIAGVMG